MDARKRERERERERERSWWMRKIEREKRRERVEQVMDGSWGGVTRWRGGMAGERAGMVLKSRVLQRLSSH